MKKQLHFISTMIVLFAMMFSSSILNAQNIVYVYDPARINDATGELADKIYMDLFEAEGYTVVPYAIRDLSNPQEGDIDSLESADLVFIGRAVGSTNFGGTDLNDPKAVAWNSLDVPIMTTNMWALRNNRLCWFDTDQCSNVAIAEGADSVFQAEIVDDPVFTPIPTDEPIDWWTGGYSTINTTDGGNGEVLATKSGDGYILFARFDGGTAFYDGGPTPENDRVYFGNDYDDVGFNYYKNLNDTIEYVFRNEVARILGVFEEYTGIPRSAFAVTLDIYPVPATDILNVEMQTLKNIEIIDITGKLVTSQAVLGNLASVNISELNSGVYILKALDTNGDIALRRFVKK